MFKQFLPFYYLTLIVLSLCGKYGAMHNDFKFRFSNENPTSMEIRTYYPAMQKQIVSLKYNESGDEIEIDTSFVAFRNPFYMITDLMACTTYRIDATVKDLKTGTLFQYYENKTTKRDPPTTYIANITTDSSSASIQLEFINMNCIDRLESAVNGTISILFGALNLTDNYRVDELLPCTSYELLIKTYFVESGKTTHSVTTEMFTTKDEIVGQVENINFDNKSNWVTWSRPSFGAQCLNSYAIQISQENGTETNTTITDEKFDFSNFLPCSNYTLIITPIGNSVGQGRTFNLQTGLQNPGPVDNLKFTEGLDYVTITWNSPNTNHLCVKGYMVVYNNKSELVNSDTRAYTVQGLQPCENFNIEVCVITVSSENGYCEELNGSTYIDPPRAVNDLYYEHTNNQLIVKWNAPSYGVNCVKGYNVSLYDKAETEVYNKLVSSLSTKQNLTVNSKTEELYLTNYSGCSSYTLRMTSIGYIAGESREIQVKTGFLEPGPVEDLKFTSGLDQITVTWSRPNTNPLCVKHYMIEYKNKSEIVNLGTGIYIIKGVEPCKNYSIKVCVITVNSEKGFCEEVTGSTEIVSPSAVNDLHYEHRENNLVVKWNAPSYGAHCVKEYNVILYDKFENEIFTKTVGTSKLRITTTNAKPHTMANSTTEELFLTNYTGCANYTLLVRSVGDIVGDSQKIPVEIGYQEPGPVEVLISSGIDDITIAWNTSIANPTCVKAYMIVFNNKSELVNSDTGFYTARGLEPCKNYNIKVCVITFNMEKDICGELTVSTLIDRPGAVNDLRYVYAGDHLVVKWNGPSYGANCVKEYIVILYDQLQKEVFNKTIQSSKLRITTNTNILYQLVNSTTEELYLTNYTGCSNYTLMVTSVGDVKGHSEKIHVQTGFLEPGPVEVLISSGSDDITIVWNSRIANSKCIKQYMLEFNNKSELISLLTGTHTIKGLQPCENYYIKLCVITINSKKDMCKELPVSTIIGRPSAVNNLKYEQTGNNLVVTWTAPSYGPKCVNGYNVTLYDKSKHEVFTRIVQTSKLRITTNTNPNEMMNSATEGVFLANYAGCSNYTLTITSLGDVVGESQTIHVETGLQEPGPVEDLKSSSSLDNITIAWRSPIANPACVDHYMVVYNDEPVHLSTNTYTIHGLKSCERYNIKVCVILTNSGEGKCTELASSTLMGPPLAVNGLNYEDNEKFLILTWNAPSYEADCVKEYNVRLYDTFGRQVYYQTVQSSPLQINTNLKSCKTYTCYITPVNLNGVAGAVQSIEIITQRTVPPKPSVPLMILKTATSLTLTSSYDNSREHCLLAYAFFKCCEESSLVVYWGNITLYQNQHQFNVTLDGLKELTNYSCSVLIANKNLLSDESLPSVFETDEQLFDRPEVKSRSSKSNSFILEWIKPEKIRLIKYHVNVLKVNKNYVVPERCSGRVEEYNATILIASDLLYYEILNLEPYTKYSVKMAIENTAGIGRYSDPIVVITAPDTPHQVNNFKVVSVNNDLTVELQWDLPCEINGEIQGFKGTFYGSQPPNRSVNVFDWNLTILDDHSNLNYYKEDRILPEHFYNITIGIEVKNFIGLRNETTVNFTSLAGVPVAYGSSIWGWVSKEPSPRDNVTLHVSKDLILSTNGKIQKFTFLITESSCADVPKPNYTFFINENDEENSVLPTWFEYENADCTGQYQLKYLYPNEFDGIDTFEFTIGSEHCDSQQNLQYHCNGPLKLGTQYAVIARVFTQNGYADTKPIYFETEKNFGTLIVILIVLSILFVAFFIGFGIMRYKVRYRNEPQPISAIPVKSFVNFYANIDFGIIEREYKTINSLDLREYTTDYAKEHKIKNRYGNILPYDQNRVILSPTAYSNSDYINASYVDGFKRKQEYIATQGPKPETCYDFWNMIIETKCHKIVMLTRLVENNITKCFQYYPDVEMELEFNDIRITNVREDDSDLYTRRDIRISKGLANRLIVHYHFKKWPDHDCPENEMDLIKFINLINSENVSSHPIVVHCSAGVGRTGTLIALDILMQQVQCSGDKYLNIQETVKNLRYQRVKMVQTFEQYEFIYGSVAKYIQWKWPNNKCR